MLNILHNNELFHGIEQHEIEGLLKCLQSRVREYQKGEFIFLAGETKPALGIILSGKSQVVKENIRGDSMIIGSLETGDLFGETFACMEEKHVPVSVVALSDCKVMLTDVGRIVNTCHSACPFHRQLISNLLKVVARKSAMLNKKMSYLTHKTIRGRLEAYFYDRIELGGSYEFTLPFNRRELSDYLCIDRSAMSRELSNMKNEGIIDINERKIKYLSF